MKFLKVFNSQIKLFKVPFAIILNFYHRVKNSLNDLHQIRPSNLSVLIIFTLWYSLPSPQSLLLTTGSLQQFDFLSLFPLLRFSCFVLHKGLNFFVYHINHNWHDRKIYKEASIGKLYFIMIDVKRQWFFLATGETLRW